MVLSGAGISAESGIATYRDPETGLWSKVDPYALASGYAWKRNPYKVWARELWQHHVMAKAQPNLGHLAVPSGRATVRWKSSPRTSSFCRCG